MQSAILRASGLYTPPHSISNEELVASFNAWVTRENAARADVIARGDIVALQESSAEFIEKASGIKSRFVIEKQGILDPQRMTPRLESRPDDALSIEAEIGVAAARQAIAAAGLTGADIDGVICAASNMQRPYPAIAIEIQAALGASGWAFDMNVACSSATFGIEMAANAVRSGSARRVLVVNPEITSAHLEWRDRDCHFIFGDVATATLIEAADMSAGGWEILGGQLATQFSNSIRNNFGFLNPAEDADMGARDKRFRQEGRKVFKEVCPMAAAHIESHLAALGLSPADVRRYWLHQANLSMNQLIGRKLLGREATADEAPVILDRYANTASAGSVIAFHLHESDLVPGNIGVLCSFGAGYSIGSLVMKKR